MGAFNVNASYCTVGDVHDITNLSFPSGSAITSGQVENIIEAVQTEVDIETRDSWRVTKVTDYYMDNPNWRALWSPRRFQQWGFGTFHLPHTNICKFDSSAGDKLEVWDGSNYTDFLTSKTEGRGKDFWVDYEKGAIFFENSRPMMVKNAIRVTYRYGNSTAPADIKRATALLTSAQLVSSEDYSVMFPEGTEQMPLKDKREKWREEAMEYLERRKLIIMSTPTV